MDVRIAYARKVIEEEYGDHWCLGQIADKLYLSLSRFKCLFKQETGQACASYLRKVRMMQAKDFLADRSLTIKQIACKVGYPYARNFVRAFKKQ